MHQREELQSDPSFTHLYSESLGLQPYIALVNCWAKQMFKKPNVKIFCPESYEHVIVYKFDVVRSAMRP